MPKTTTIGTVGDGKICAGKRTKELPEICTQHRGIALVGRLSGSGWEQRRLPAYAQLESKPANSDVDVPLHYADYYYLEALKRLRDWSEK